MTGALTAPLFCPASDPDKVVKSFRYAATATIVDLEDAVAASQKHAAREAVVSLFDANVFRGRLLIVRVNSLGSGLMTEDLEAVVRPGLSAVMMPKAETAEDVRAAHSTIRRVEKSAGLSVDAVRLIPLIETARGVVNAQQILSASTRIVAGAFGSVDYLLDLGVNSSDVGIGPELLYPRSAMVVASRVANVSPPVDGPFLDTRDDVSLLAQCQHARALGFQGKLLIHPAQIPVCLEGFAPNRSELQEAAAIVQAFEAAEHQGRAATLVEGRLVDYPVYERARTLLHQLSDTDQPARNLWS